MVVQGNLLSFEPSKMSLYCNTLQAIASGYLIAAICLLHLSIRWQVVVTGLLLVVYWLVMKFVPFSDPVVGSCTAGMLEPGRNLALLLDKYLMGDWQDKTNYAWILAQFGFRGHDHARAAGRPDSERGAGAREEAGVAAWRRCGLPDSGICLEPGFSYHQAFVHQLHGIVGGGWCYFLLALFYLLTDVLKLNWLTFFFSVIGSNAIFVYMWAELCPPTRNFSRVLFTGFSECFGDANRFVFYLCNYALIWGVLYYMYKNRTFIKV